MDKLDKCKIAYSKKYKKQIKKFDKSTIKQIENIIDRLANHETLEKQYNDHALQGRLKGLRDCHIKPDLVLIYAKDNDILLLSAMQIGSHSELFG